MVYTNKDGYGVRRKGFLRWTIDKPMQVKPEIEKEITIDGEVYVKAKDGREYKKSVFEQMFGKVK